MNTTKIEELGYILKRKGYKNNLEYIYKDISLRPYIVSIDDSFIEIIFESKLNKSHIRFLSFIDFVSWHNEFINQ